MPARIRTGPRLVSTAIAGWKRRVLFALGCLFTAIGIVGVILPLIPGTVFLILAAACFARSSPRFEALLLSDRYLGPPVLRWREHGIISRRAKIIACTGMAASVAMLMASGAPALVTALTTVALAASAVYVVSRPERPRV